MKRKNILKGDMVIWTVYIMLTIISLVAVYSSIGLSAITEHRGATPTSLMLRHALFVVVSFAIVWIMSRTDYRKYSRISQIGYFISIGLLLYVLITGEGEGRWISLFGIRFQPSEIAKICLIMYVARLLNRSREELDTPATFSRLLISILFVVVLILLKNFSTAALVFLTCYLMMYFAGVNKKYWWGLLGILVVVGGIALLVLSKNYQDVQTDGMMGRSSTWGHRIDSWLHPDDGLSQANMAKMAVARGGLTGVGIGNTIHARLITQAHNDFIFSIIIEEAGSLTGIVIFLLYSVLFFRCIQIARRCKGTFGSLCVAGYGTVIYLQALMNMGVAVGLTPVTGQTLPFISYGGTAYMFMSCGVGIVQAVANDNKKNMNKTKGSLQESPSVETTGKVTDTEK